MENLYDVIIIGSGPAGLSAAIYAKRAKLSSLTIEANFASGGQVLNTYEVDNYPGHPGISGQVKIRSDSATGYQAVAVGPWLAVFAMTPPDDLSELVDTVRVN